MRRIRTALIALLLILIVSLSADDLIVVNNLAETLSRVDLETGLVDNNFVSVGLIPNHIVCRDGKAYVVNSGSDDLYLINLGDETIEEVIDLGSGRNPWASTFINDSTLLVTNFIASTISKVSLSSNSVIGEWPVNSRPQNMLTLGDLTYIAITGFNPADTSYGPGQVALWDNSGDSIIEYIDVGTNPQDLDIGPDNRLYVVCSGDYEGLPGMLYIVDTSISMAVDSFVTATTFFPPTDVIVSSQGVGFLAAGGWFTDGEVYTFDAATGVMLHDQNNPLKTSLGVLAVIPASDSTIYTMNFGADNITEMDSAGQILNTYFVGDGPQFAAINMVEGPDYICGDANSDHELNVSDAVYIINFVFSGGNAPDPMESGDTNCDGEVNVSDAVWIINFVFENGFEPCDTNGDGSGDC